MVTTEDGFKVKRGEVMWAIGADWDTRKRRPFRVKAHSRSADYNHDGLKVWKEWSNCLIECDKLNNIKTNSNGRDL